MGYKRIYPSKYMEALYNLESAAEAGEVAKYKYEKCFARKAYWTFLDGIPLEAPPIINYDENTGQVTNITEIPVTLKEFISDVCKGNIEATIEVIDRLTKEVGFTVDLTNKYQLFDHLQMTGSFLREVSSIIRKSKHRPERHIYTEKYFRLPVNTKTNVDIFNSDTAKVITDYLKEYPNVVSAPSPIHATGPRTPNPIVAGYCLVCHRPSPYDSFYCSYHTNNKSEKKKEQRRVTNAFEYLDYKLPNENHSESDGLDKSVKEKAFQDKCYILEGWAKHRPEHTQFNTELESIAGNYFDLYTAHDWPNDTAKMLNEIVQLTNRHRHTSGVFNLLFSPKDSIEKLKEKLQLNVFNVTDYETDLTPSTTITIISRISQFALIKTASSKKNNRLLI